MSVQRWVLACAVGYILMAGAITLFQRRLIYFPDRQPVNPIAAGLPDVHAIDIVADDGVSLIAWYKVAEAGRATVLYLHGNGGNLSDRAAKVRPYLRAGFGILLLSWRGYGGSGGSPSEVGLRADARAALNKLETMGVPSEQVVVYGESLGSALAVQLAATRRVGVVVLEAPFTSAVELGANTYPFLPVRWLMWDRYDTLSQIGAVSAPILILHGDQDRIVPVSHGKRLFDKANSFKDIKILEGASHNNVESFGAAAAVLEFIERRLKY